MQATLKRTAEVVDLMTSSRVPRIYTRIEELHKENLVQIRAAGEKDGGNNVPDTNSLLSSDTERRIPLSYKQLILEECLPLKAFQASLRSVESGKRKVIEREAIFRIEQEIEQIKSRWLNEQKKEKRLSTNANNFLLENPLVVNFIFILLLLGEAYLNDNAMRFFGIPKEASVIISVGVTATLLVFAKKIGSLSKRSQGQSPEPTSNPSLGYGILYVIGIVMLSYCRAYFIVNGEDTTGDASKAAEEAAHVLSKLDWTIFGNFTFIMTLFFHLILGGLSFMIGYEGVDSSKSFEEAYLDSLRIKELEEEHKKLTDFDHRMTDQYLIHYAMNLTK